jgi:hypothetical protein
VSSHLCVHMIQHTKGPRRPGGQCHFAQSHDPIGSAELSESYTFVVSSSIIELFTLHLVTMSELVSHAHTHPPFISRSDSKTIYVYILMIIQPGVHGSIDVDIILLHTSGLIRALLA